MFDHDLWRRRIAERLSGFARNPRQELQITGAPNLLSYLVMRTIEPFLEAFQDQPIDAVIALAEITRGSGADAIVGRAARMRYQSAAQLDRELRSSQCIRVAAEQLLIELHTIPSARRRLNGAREEWMRSTLSLELEQFPGEFVQLRRVLHDPGWQTRYEALRNLRKRKGHYTPADLVLIHDGLSDSAVHVRAAAVRALGMIAAPPPQLLLRTLIRVALHDFDAETRYAAARALGMLREHVTSPQLIDHLVACLFDDDRFVRSAAAMVLGELGDIASAPNLVSSLTQLLNDPDPYAREAAARALGRIGPQAATPEVLAALAVAAENGDVNVHEAATDSILRLRRSRAPTQLAVSA